MDLKRIKTVGVGDLVVYEYGKEPSDDKEYIVSHGRIRYMGYCTEIDGDYAKIQNIAMMRVNDLDFQWEMIPQDEHDELQSEVIRQNNKIMAWIPKFEIYIPEVECKDLNLVNLSAIYNFDERYVEQIKKGMTLEQPKNRVVH